MTINDPVLDLTNCDREPIHIPGSIQPHGCLLACDNSAGRILRHSANTQAMLGTDGDPNGRPIEELLGEEAAHTVRNALARSNDASRPSQLFGLKLGSGRIFNVAVHRFKSTAIIELEPVEAQVTEPITLARALIGRTIVIETADRMIRDTARLLRAMLGYDRVMIYQFTHDGSGKVMSESKRAELESFLGQYFPAGDIPQQARELYLRNTIRIISDVNFERIPIVPALDASGEPVDLSYAHLRSVSPVHCEYLRNMGVGASMSISIIVDGALWGLIACHHYSAKTMSMSERVAAEMFGEFFSLHLNVLKQKHKLEAATLARQSLDRFLRLTARASNIEEVMRENLPDFAELVRCDGVGMWLNGTWKSGGSAPPETAAPALARFAQSVAEGKVWATHMLSNHLPESEDYSAQVSGVMVVPLSQRPRDYLFFFRKELVHTLDWAGNPEKNYEVGPLGDRLTPRKSFALWKETVHHQSDPWTEEERDIAEATRAALVEIVLHHSELLEDERAKADVRQRMLNEELNHRVKNILAVIKSLVTQPGQDDQSLENYVDSLRGRIQALAYAHDQVVRGDGGGALADLVNAELTPYRSPGSTIDLEGPAVWLDARAFSVMALALHELSTNSAKYGALSCKNGALSVKWSFDEGGACEIHWRESGGPAVKAPARIGFGTTLIDRSIPFDLGGKSNVKYLPDGLQGEFRLPARNVSEGKETAIGQTGTKAPTLQPFAATDLSGIRVLAVEDQMLIAMDLEQIFTDHGVTDIKTAGSSAEALEKLRSFTPDIAILDINLGADTSVLVAEELERRKVPFAFATGYGDKSIIPERFASAPVVRKPYEAISIIGQVSQLLRRP